MTRRPDGDYFEDFSVGDKYQPCARHHRRRSREPTPYQARDEHRSRPLQRSTSQRKRRPSDSGIVFGLVTGSIVIGLATQDTAENAIAELTLDKIALHRPRPPRRHVVRLHRSAQHQDRQRNPPAAGIVRFKHWGANQDATVVFETETHRTNNEANHPMTPANKNNQSPLGRGPGEGRG